MSTGPPVKSMVVDSRAPLLLILALSASPVAAQFPTKLQPRTVTEFETYAHRVEQQLATRWQGQKSFLAIGDDPAERQKVLAGDLLIRPAVPDNPVSISGGLIHDWLGAAFIPNVKIQKVLSILQDFDAHSHIYPSVVNSRLIRRDGNHLTGYWRLERKDPLFPEVLDVEQDAYYQRVGSGKWTCRAYAKNISEVQNAGSAQEKKLPPGQGNGFLWQFYAYWSLESTGNGVLAECRTLSLSRSVPAGLMWAVKPFIQKLPRESLASTLENTRTAATK